MSFKKLYDLVQEQQNGPISTKWLKERVFELSTIKRIKEEWSGLIDPANLRGAYIEGPMGPPVPIGENEALIVISRAICKGASGPQWRRFVFTKELMHCFDTPEEKAADAEAFVRQIQRLRDPAAEVTTQYRAELKAYWRALAALCPEKQRLELKSKLQKSEASIDVVSAALRLPVPAIRHLMGDSYEQSLKHSF